MGKSAPSPPPAPDPTLTASAQGAANVATATANTALQNANSYTPYGQTTYTQTGSVQVPLPDGTMQTVPTYSVRQDLSGTQQNLLNQQEQIEQRLNGIAGSALGRVGQTLSNPLQASQFAPIQTSVGGTPTLATGYDGGGQIQGTYGSGGQVQSSVAQQQAPTTFGQTAGGIQYNVDQQGIQQARDSATNAALARLQPGMDQQNAQLQAQLANQGIGLGSSAYGAAQLNQAQQQNDLRLGAVQTGDQEQQALYNQALQSGQFTNAAQAQDFGQQQARGQFAQAGTAANNASALAAGSFANSAQAQGEQENAARAAFGNAAQGQQNAQNAAQAAFGNTAAMQDYQNRLAGGAFNNQAVNQQLQQAMALQNQQINEISALRAGTQVQLPQSQAYQGGTVDQTPISADTYASAGIQNQQYLAQLQASAANQAAMGQAFGGIGSMLGRKSDRRLKSDVAPVARARNGLMIYRYRMACEGPGWHLGFMADEVALVHPGAVWTDPGDGFARVDYERAVA